MNCNHILSWFTRNTKNCHIVYNWLPYSKPIERDALCPDVHVADFQTFKKRKQSCLMSRMEFQYHRYVRLGIHPNQYYDMQKQAFSGLPHVFPRDTVRQERSHQREVDNLKANLSHKDEVIAELRTEHIALKKRLEVKN